MVCCGDDIQAAMVLVHILHERGQQLLIVVEDAVNCFSTVVLKTDLAAEEGCEVEVAALCQYLDGASEVDLVLV